MVRAFGGRNAERPLRGGGPGLVQPGDIVDRSSRDIVDRLIGDGSACKKKRHGTSGEDDRGAETVSDGDVGGGN
jgi:hypothetical protein